MIGILLYVYYLLATVSSWISPKDKQVVYFHFMCFPYKVVLSEKRKPLCNLIPPIIMYCCIHRCCPYPDDVPFQCMLDKYIRISNITSEVKLTTFFFVVRMSSPCMELYYNNLNAKTHTSGEEDIPYKSSAYL